MDVTRYGAVRKFEPRFSKEERFRLTSSASSSDVIYVLPDVSSSRRVFFGSSVRGEDSASMEQKKNTVGPGTYEVLRCIDKTSDYRTRRSSRFGNASRESMVMRTPSPGAIYNLRNSYWNGPENRISIGFNCDQRKPLYTATTGADADAVNPRPPVTRSITIGKKIYTKPRNMDVPGPIYDVLVCATHAH